MRLGLRPVSYTHLDVYKRQGQDIELPLPNDMLESIIQEILKSEFGIYPQDLDIKDVYKRQLHTRDKDNNIYHLLNVNEQF